MEDCLNKSRFGIVEGIRVRKGYEVYDYNDEGIKVSKTVYKVRTPADPDFYDEHGCWEKYIYDNRENVITYLDSKGIKKDYTYDDKGRELTCRDSNGHGYNWSYNDDDQTLTYTIIN